ncbi:hypothetical protein LTR17_022681 [Elasticomyces elasticus]|nr:hypothetical protein LTR17_022681 [Elasticomyces elasticus]
MCEATDGRDKLYGIGALLRLSRAVVEIKHPSGGVASAGRHRFRSQAECIPLTDCRKSVRSVFFGVADNQSETMTPSRVPDWRVRSGRSVIAFDPPSGAYSKTMYCAGGNFEDPMLLLRGSREEKGRQYITVGVIVLGTIKEVFRTNLARGPRIDRGAGLRSWDNMIWLHRNPNANLTNAKVGGHDLFREWSSAIDMEFSFANEATEIGPEPDYRLLAESLWPQWTDDDELPSTADESAKHDPQVETRYTPSFTGANDPALDHPYSKAYEDNLFLDEFGIKPQDYGLRMSATHRLMLLDNDTYALGPAQAKIDDIVCVMIGASIPFVIRRATEEEGSAVLVGECWMKSVMQGEAVRWKENESYGGSFTVSKDFEQRGYRVERLYLF